MTESAVIRHINELSSIREEWVDAHRESTEESPFVSFEFLKLWYECFAEPDQVRVYRVSDGTRTVGFLPLVRRKNRGIRVLESLTNDHCFHGDPLVREGHMEGFPELLLQEVIRDWRNWDLFRHKFSYSFSGVPGIFPDDLLASCGLRWEKTIEPTYSILIKRPFDEYYRGDLTRESRKAFRNNKNRLAREGEIRYRHCEGREALRLWPEFLRLEDSGWKGRAGSSIKRLSPNYRRYYEGLVELLADSGRLRFIFLEVNDRLVAGEFGYFVGDTFHAFKTGYDEAMKQCSPGNLLLMHMLEHFSENHPQTSRFHLFPWDQGYKHRYVNENEYCFETRLFGKTLRGKGSYLSSRAKKVLKRVLRRDQKGES